PAPAPAHTAPALPLAQAAGHRLVIDRGTEAALLADRIAERGVPVMLGRLLTSRSKVEVRNRSIANPGRLAAAGVEIGIITDHPVVPIDLLQVQAALAGKEGLAAGRGARGGASEPGKAATLGVWSGDPLDVRSRVEAVWIDGHQVLPIPDPR